MRASRAEIRERDRFIILHLPRWGQTRLDVTRRASISREAKPEEAQTGNDPVTRSQKLGPNRRACQSGSKPSAAEADLSGAADLLRLAGVAPRAIIAQQMQDAGTPRRRSLGDAER